MQERLVLMGGTFNPVHNGHLAMAKAARDALPGARVLFIPTGDPPHKGDLAPAQDRLTMTRLAAEPHFEVSSLEIDRVGKTYTVDTLETLHARYPDAELWLIVGADTVSELVTWRNPTRVFQLCQFLAFARDSVHMIAPSGARVTAAHAVIPPISSTMIRKCVHKGFPIDTLTSPAVCDYIRTHRLYNPPERWSERAIERHLSKSLSPSRFAHTKGVVETIQILAKRWDADVEKSMRCALLHDCAKGMTLDAMQAFATKHALPVDAQKRKSTALLHAPVGAAIAQSLYGETDPAILTAIAGHNTGDEDLSLFTKLLIVADMIEPNRQYDLPALNRIRTLAQTDLDNAVQLSLERKIAYTLQSGKTVHPDTARALAALISQKEETP